MIVPIYHVWGSKFLKPSFNLWTHPDVWTGTKKGFYQEKLMLDCWVLLRYQWHSLIPPPGKLAWRWKNNNLKMYLLFKIVIFRCHVSFPRSTLEKTMPPKGDEAFSFWQGLLADLHDKISNTKRKQGSPSGSKRWYCWRKKILHHYLSTMDWCRILSTINSRLQCLPLNPTCHCGKRR